MKQSDTGMLRLIAAFKLIKAILLIAVGVGVLNYLHKDLSCALEHWVALLRLDPGNRFVDRALQKAANLTPHKIKLVGLGSFIYAGLFLVEGTGLWQAKRWAEWLTIIITSSLLPIEIYECYHHLTVIKILVLLINIAVVAYLVYRIRKHEK
ncbi:MAG: DUF2127 domain-containing protein [Acidobacteriota bacterium]|nr:DUF2127 domain-containing protein [Acidobacteriota bacterium]